MRKKTEYGLKAEKRAIKKRPRMRVHGAALKRPNKFAGRKLSKQR